MLGYANTGPYLQYLPPDFRDWLRVYRVPGTVFPVASPDGRQTTTMTEFGFPAETRLFTVGRGQTRKRDPDGHGAGRVATRRTERRDGAQYRLYVVRQADLEDIPTASP